MPVPSIIEGRRIAVTGGANWAYCDFLENHVTTPVVSIMLEPTVSGSWSAATVSDVTLTRATIRFSSPFDGYLHLHAFSVV
jgi:hypothetical protein